jgi:hypothetical protein
MLHLLQVFFQLRVLVYDKEIVCRDPDCEQRYSIDFSHGFLQLGLGGFNESTKKPEDGDKDPDGDAVRY